MKTMAATPHSGSTRSTLAIGALGWSALGSIVALLAIRIYAIFWTVHIVTWDDRWYRRFVYDVMAHTSLRDAICGVFLPTSATENNHKTIGYHSWMILFGKLFPHSNTENVWHVMNLGMLALQCCLVLGLAFWATRRLSAALVIAYFYLSCPILFGINRWLFTENHVITSLLIFSSVGVWLLEAEPRRQAAGARKRSLSRTLGLTALAGYIFGIFSTLREYALPSFALIVAALIIGLIVERRWLSAAVFGFALFPFLVAIAGVLPPVALFMLTKADQMVYFHPLWQWVPHVLTFGIGWSLTFLLGATGVLLFRSMLGGGGFMAELSLARRSGLRILFWAHAFVALVYVLLIITSKNRVVRPVIPPLVTVFCMALLGLRIHGIAERISWRRVNRVWVPLMLASWSFMIFELFLAYHGGRTYRLHPFPMERYNHPLFLRALKGPDDMHVIPAKHAWEYTYPPQVEE